MLTWSVYFLATHQDIQEKVYQEVKEKIGDQDVSPANIVDLVWVVSHQYLIG